MMLLWLMNMDFAGGGAVTGSSWEMIPPWLKRRRIATGQK